jgi:hypothetical protein
VYTQNGPVVEGARMAPLSQRLPEKETGLLVLCRKSLFLGPNPRVLSPFRIASLTLAAIHK